jgi:hypothetical protein
LSAEGKLLQKSAWREDPIALENEVAPC